MRDLCEIIDRMLEVIPEDQTILREKLESHYESVMLSPPEMILFQWNEVGDTLYQFVFSDFYPEVEWQDKIERIWTGDEDQDELVNSNF